MIPSSFRMALVALSAACAIACGEDTASVDAGVDPLSRCEVDLEATGLFSQVGSGASARTIVSADELIGGQAAHGALGDYLLQNDRIRVVVSQAGRHFWSIPYGGWIVDADLRRPAGSAGRDQFGRLGFLYAFGRTVNGQRFEVLDDGQDGGAAILAVTGLDTLNDFLDLPQVISANLPGITLQVDPNQALPLKITTYYVLSPGESRVRILTAMCNEGSQGVTFPLGDVLDQGGSTEQFNPEGCTKGMGNDGCLVDPSHGLLHQGAEVAYGYRTYAFGTDRPANDAVLTFGGVSAILASAEGSSGFLSWIDAQAPRRPGAFGIRGGESRTFLRDFFVARDIAEVTSEWNRLDAKATGRLSVSLSTEGGQPLGAGRVAVRKGDRQVTLLVADAQGKAHVDLEAGSYELLFGKAGHPLPPPVAVQVASGATTQQELTVGASRTLRVRVKDPFGAPMPGKVTVLCRTSACPTPANAYKQLEHRETFPSDVAAIAFVPPQGVVDVRLPPGAYEVLVTRGPEYSVFPDTFPTSGAQVDLSAGDQSLEATLAQVVDSTGWVSADLHVHAMASPDSSVDNTERVLSFMAEGIEVMVSTDHDAITDFGPFISQLQGTEVMASMIGTEVSPMYGHFNAFPVVRTDTANGGAFDWAGGEGPTLSAREVFAGVHAAHPGSIVQLNHARGGLGVLTSLKVDTDTLASHADPLTLRISPAADATATNTRLFSDEFDAIEVANGTSASVAILNDWMTFLSRGTVRTATAVSDTHDTFRKLGGGSRTYLFTGQDAPAAFTPAVFTEAMRKQFAFGTNGPFVKLTARRLDAAGTPQGEPVPVGGLLQVSPSSGEKVELTVDVQAPEWMTFDTLEVYTHADGREALDGKSNSEWPETRVHQRVTLDPATLPVEAVPGQNGFTVRRIHVVERLVVEATRDTWFMVIVRGSGSTAALYPIAYGGVGCSDGICRAEAPRPYAFTNAILIDADGSGAYDDFPLKVPRALRVNRPEPLVPSWTPRTIEQMRPALEALNHCAHHDP